MKYRSLDILIWRYCRKQDGFIRKNKCLECEKYVEELKNCWWNT